MNRMILITGLAVLLAAVLTSCEEEKKADDENQLTNYMQIGQDKYELDKGFISKLDMTNGDTLQCYDIVLLSPGLNYHKTNGYVDSVSGAGNAFVVETLSANFSFPEPGTYQSHQDGPRKAMLCDLNAIIGFVGMSGYGDYYDYDGTMNLSKTGNEYEISVTAQDTAGVNLTVHYKGQLEIVDDGPEK